MRMRSKLKRGSKEEEAAIDDARNGNRRALMREKNNIVAFISIELQSGIFAQYGPPPLRMRIIRAERIKAKFPAKRAVSNA